MRWTKSFIPTLREDPADAEVISHKLLVRAGYIRRVASGIYDFLPLAMRVLAKIERIVREEMARAGAEELRMPIVQPAGLWRQSGRWEKYGPELLRLRDRHDQDFCLGPTHEEVICALVARELRSYKQLPICLYQIHTKFRDEIRPRFGLMRAREFVMKDAYSFHADEEDLKRTYQTMFEAYQRIFSRLGLSFRAVEADTGAIGGRASHEFHVLAASGEDRIAYCERCDYAANVELAKTTRALAQAEDAPLRRVATPGASAVEEVAEVLGVSPERLVKTLVFRLRGGEHDGKVVAGCVAGDDALQPVKLARAFGADEAVLAGEEEIRAIGGVPGFVGPLGLKADVLLDRRLQGAVGLIVGANEPDAHLVGFSPARDLASARFADLREARAGDCCARCGGKIAIARGIEVGHVFELGDVYSRPMGVMFQDAEGARRAALMGCYGIGISRLLAAIVEQHHDDAGIAWPAHLAPFPIVVLPLGKGEAMQAAEGLYAELRKRGVDALLDDRDERPGVKFRDAELVGVPIWLVVGAKGVARGVVELGMRGQPRRELPLAEAAAEAARLVEEACRVPA